MLEIKISYEYCQTELKHRKGYYIEVRTEIGIYDDQAHDPLPKPIHFCDIKCLDRYYQ